MWHRASRRSTGMRTICCRQSTSVRHSSCKSIDTLAPNGLRRIRRSQFPHMEPGRFRTSGEPSCPCTYSHKTGSRSLKPSLSQGSRPSNSTACTSAGSRENQSVIRIRMRSSSNRRPRRTSAGTQRTYRPPTRSCRCTCTVTLRDQRPRRHAPSNSTRCCNVCSKRVGWCSRSRSWCTCHSR